MPEANNAPDPIPRIADVLWPDTTAEWDLRTRLAELSGSNAARSAWELFALRDHALDVMYSLIHDGRNVPRDMTMTILALLEPRAGLVPAPPDADAWRSHRDALYTRVMPGHEDRPYAEIWKDWIERVGSCFASALDCTDGDVGRIGAQEYDRAAKQLFPICKQLPDQWR